MGMPPTRPYIAAVLLLGMVGTSPAHAQQPAASARHDLEAIRRQFVEQPTESKLLGPVRADYTVRVEEDQDDFDTRFGWIYDQTTMTPGYIRPWYPIHHFDMLSMTVPTEHRAQLYPAAISAGDLFGGIKDAARRRKERQAKEQVQAEVKALQKK
jgi:hypothetical protein